MSDLEKPQIENQLEAESREENDKKERVFVEMGTGRIPVPFLGSKQFKDNERYIGVELDKESLKEARERVERVAVDEERIDFVEANGERLPLRSSSVDEFFLGNVLGDPRVAGGSKEKFIEEAERVLKKGGRLIIKENNTPLEISELRKLLKDRKLELEKFLTPKDKNWSEEIQKYHKVASGADPWWPIYVAIFKKI